MTNKFVIVDLETTGHSPEQGDRIIEIGIVLIKNGEIYKTYSSLINPEQDISPFISNLTNITNEDVRDAPIFSEIAKEIIGFFNDAYFVAHNVPFDLRFLNGELENANFPILRNQTIDTVEVSRIMFPQASSYKLNELAEYMGIEHTTPHRALADALVTAKILFKIKSKFRNLPYETLSQLLKLEAYFQSDLYEILQSQRDQLAFNRKDEDNFNSYQGIAFKKRREIRGKDIHYSDQFGPLLDDIYEKNGRLEEALKDYEKRSGQRKISEVIFDSLLHKNHCLIEAGTGIGKTIGYLIPAIFKSVTDGERLILSTYTTQLQAQLINKEIPLLKKILPFPFEVAMLKGQRHYLSLERFIAELNHPNFVNNYDIALTKAMILVWITETDSGDIDEIQLSKSGYYFFEQVSTKAEGRLDPQSPWFKYSYYIKAKQQAQAADLIVTNHALLCTDLYNDYEFIPTYKYAIIDEAHHFEQAASKQMALTVENTVINYTLNQLGNIEEMKFIPLLKEGLLQSLNWNQIFEETKQTVNELFQAVTSYVNNTQRGKGNTSDTGRKQYRLTMENESNGSWDSIGEMASNTIFRLKEITQILFKISRQIEDKNPHSEKREKDIYHFIDTLDIYTDTLISFFNMDNLSEKVKWVEIESDERVYLYEKPLSVAEFLQEGFFSQKDSVVFTSATLTMKDSFTHMIRQLGLSKENLITKQIQSPYDYEDQVLFMVPKDFPQINQEEEEFIYATCEAISSITEITKGKTLVLFTSYHMLRKCYYLLQETIDTNEYRLIGQGISSGSRSRLQKNFQTFEKSILLGTSSFWEGIDIPGEDLSSLIIVRLPFQPPNDPVYEAKAKELEKEGKNAFFSLSLPEAVIRFKQGFGRLIRSHKDRGTIFVCDSRMMTASYKSFFTKSIPNLKIHYDDTNQLIKRLKDWF